jgi:hypothetical protein
LYSVIDHLRCSLLACGTLRVPAGAVIFAGVDLGCNGG